MYQIVYYTEPSGRQPVAEWLDILDTRALTLVRSKMSRLEENGLMLLRTAMVKRIEDGDKDFYELRGGSYRIAFYHDTVRDYFVLLHGFVKRRQRETREISLARARLHEYQSRR